MWLASLISFAARRAERIWKATFWKRPRIGVFWRPAFFLVVVLICRALEISTSAPRCSAALSISLTILTKIFGLIGKFGSVIVSSILGRFSALFLLSISLEIQIFRLNQGSILSGDALGSLALTPTLMVIRALSNWLYPWLRIFDSMLGQAVIVLLLLINSQRVCQNIQCCVVELVGLILARILTRLISRKFSPFHICV